MTEAWADIPGYEGIYKVSDLGRVKSLSRPTPCIRGFRVIRERILKYQLSSRVGYPAVVIYKRGVPKTAAIHRLVMLAFVGAPPPGMEVCHNNGDPTDNRLANLRYGTRKENREDGRRLGEIPVGQDRVQAKLTWSDIDRIREMVLFGGRRRDVAAIFGINTNHVGTIVRYEQWSRRPVMNHPDYAEHEQEKAA